MTNPIGRRVDRLETEVQRKTDPGYGPVFELIDDHRDPENVKRLEEARQFKRDNPNGLIIHYTIVHPPTGEPNWEGVSREERERWLAAYDGYDGLKNTFQEPKAQGTTLRTLLDSGYVSVFRWLCMTILRSPKT